MPQTANEAFRDALIRHQVGLMRFAGHVRNRVLSLLDAADASLRERIERSTAGLTPSAVARGGVGRARLEALEGAISQMRGAAFDRALGAWQEELQGLAKAEPVFVAAAMQASVPVVLSLALPDAQRLRALATSNPFEGKTLREWGEQLRRSDRDRILQQIRIGLLQGDGPQDIARRVVGSQRLHGADGATEITRRAATSLTRTSINHLANEVRRELYVDNQDVVDEEAFVATLDSRTTAICASLDGRRFPVGEGPRPPMHIGCRSTRVAVIGGGLIGDRPLKASSERELVREFADERGLGRVSSRDGLPRGAKGEFDKWARRQVRLLTGAAPAETTYSQFLTRQSRAFQEDVLGVTKARLFREGGLTLDRFVNRAGDELTLKELARREADAFRGAGLDPSDFL